MNCQQSKLSTSTMTFVPCPNPATVRVWCPTWVNTRQKESGTLAFGPRPNTTINRMPATVMHLCDGCADNFRPEKNPNSKDGVFYWGDEAEARHAEAEKAFAEGKNIV